MMNSLEIAERFGLLHIGESRAVDGFSVPSTSTETSILWVKTEDVFLSVDKGVVVADHDLHAKARNNVTYLFTKKSPRLMFARILNEYFKHLAHDDFKNCVDEHRLNSKLQIGENVFIAEDVRIGDGTMIHHNACIYGGTEIGANCVIGSNSSISTVGMGFEYDGDEIVSFPQLGGVLIEDDVEIGPQTTVRRGALANTHIKTGAKIGAFCNIGHNSTVGDQSILTCKVVVGGSARLGIRNYIGVGASIKNKVNVSDNVTIGMGAVVVRDVPEGATMVGIPAKQIQS